MQITVNGNRFENISAYNECVASLLPVEIYEKGADGVNITDNFFVTENLSQVDSGLFRRLVRIANHHDRTYEIKMSVGALTGFLPEHWLIPCVMYNGNPYGSRNSPKGLTCNGQPWVFSYDRSGIPACTISEDTQTAFSMFASDRDGRSLRCSCSVEKNEDGRFIHRLIYPVNETPVSYTGKNVMSGAYVDYLTLEPGAAIEFLSYISISEPRWTNYGFCNVLTHAMKVLRHDHLPAMDAGTIGKVCLDYLKKSRHEADGAILFSVGYRDYTHPVGNNQNGGPWDGLTLEILEKQPSLNRMTRTYGNMYMGFSAQGMMTLRMLLADAFKNNDGRLRDEIIALLDGWCAVQRPNGLLCIRYPGEENRADPSNLGWGTSELIKIYILLQKNAVNGDKYLDCAKGICNFFIGHYDENDPFGRLWNLDGEKLSAGGCNGSFIIKAMLELYGICGDTRYLDCAKSAFDTYFRLYLDAFCCSAGAIDCDSVDKESSFPFVYSGLALYRATGNGHYLDCAQKAAAYFLSWMFCYDALYDSGSDFERLGYHTSGGTVVSVEHQCIDPYAAVIVADLYDLASESGNSLWSEAGRMIWVNSTQCIAGPEGMTFHGMYRPAGAQNECFAQTRWSKYRSSPEARGHMNDFLGIWLCCFKLYTLDRYADPMLRTDTDKMTLLT